MWNSRSTLIINRWCTLRNMHIVNARLARTMQKLSEFTFVIKYVPGRDNLVADALSRLHEGGNNVSHKSDQLPVGLKTLPPVPGGGNSMFESLLKSSEDILNLDSRWDASTLRQALVDELMKDPKSYGLNINKVMIRKLKLMRHSGQLPCLELLLSFSLKFTVLYSYIMGVTFQLCTSTKMQEIAKICPGYIFNASLASIIIQYMKGLCMLHRGAYMAIQILCHMSKAMMRRISGEERAVTQLKMRMV